MNLKRKHFADLYVKFNRDGKRAAIEAGYSANTAASQACQMLSEPEVSEYVNSEFAAIYERNKMSIDEAVSILIDIGRTNAADLFHPDGTAKRLDEIPLHALRAIEEVETETVYEWDEMTERKVPVTRIKKFKTTGAKSALVEVLKVMGGYKIDNEQKAITPIMLNINPLAVEAQPKTIIVEPNKEKLGA